MKPAVEYRVVFGEIEDDGVFSHEDYQLQTPDLAEAEAKFAELRDGLESDWETECRCGNKRPGGKRSGSVRDFFASIERWEVPEDELDEPDYVTTKFAKFGYDEWVDTYVENSLGCKIEFALAEKAMDPEIKRKVEREYPASKQEFFDLYAAIYEAETGWAWEPYISRGWIGE